MINETISPSGYKIIPIWIAMSHACLCTGFISASFSVSLAPVIDTRISWLATNAWCEHYLTRVFDMASSAENSNSFTGPTMPWSSVIPTQWRSISGRVSIVRFGDGAFCLLEQRWLAPTDYQFTLSLVSPWLFPPSFFLLFFIFYLLLFFIYYFFILTSVLLIFKWFIYFLLLSFFLF